MEAIHSVVGANMLPPLIVLLPPIGTHVVFMYTEPL